MNLAIVEGRIWIDGGCRGIATSDLFMAHGITIPDKHEPYMGSKLTSEMEGPTPAEKFFASEIRLCFIGDNPNPVGYVRTDQDAVKFANAEANKNKTVKILNIRELVLKTFMEELKELRFERPLM